MDFKISYAEARRDGPLALTSGVHSTPCGHIMICTFIPCALRGRIEGGTGSRDVNWTQEAQYIVPCEVHFHLQLAVVFTGLSFILIFFFFFYEIYA